MKGILWAVLQEPIAVPPIFTCGSPHHITLFYDVDKTKYEKYIGEDFHTFSLGNCHNGDIQALLCDIPSRIPHKPNPHITISYREGIEPNASNQMLLGNYNFESLIMPLKLKIEFFEFPIKRCVVCHKVTKAKGDYCAKHRHKDPNRIALAKALQKK